MSNPIEGMQNTYNNQNCAVANQAAQQNVYGDFNVRQVFSQHGANNDEACLRELRLTDPRDDMRTIESTKDNLIEDSCLWILEDRAFLDWWNGQGFRFLWIHGDPGKGKTMMTIALIRFIRSITSKQMASGAPDAMSFFFCQKTVPELNRATSVLRGLIYLLVSKHKNLIRHLQKPYGEAGNRLFEGPNVLSSLWQILLDILQDRSLSTVYLVVDALDECDDDVFRLLEWIIYTDTQLESRVKWLVTSRNEPRIKELLKNNDLLHASLELNSSHVSKAVSTFIDTKVAELARQKQYSSELQLWIKNYLQCNAEGTFLWAALICKELKHVRPARAHLTLQEFPAGLQSLYEQMLKRVESKSEYESEDVDFCKKILCSVTLASRPLSLEELVVFADFSAPFQDEKNVLELVDRCGSFLVNRKKTVYFVHQSAKDYLSTGEGSRIFKTSQSNEHARIADLCLQVMQVDLKRGICNDLPARVSYACVHWVFHFKQADRGGYNLQDNGPVHQFLKKHLLHWLEAVSKMKKMSDGILAIKDFEFLLPSSESELTNFVHDAKRFALKNRPIIEEESFQVYCSALFFAPEMSLIRKNFEDQVPQWIRMLSSVPKEWSSLLQTLEGHRDSINAVAFSPDGKQVASASSDQTIRLWDAATGASQHTLKGHTGWVNAIAFSPDGNQVASASSDETIRLWDAATGASQHTLKGHTDWVTAVAFLPDGKQVASASLDRTIRLWDMVTGASQGTLEGHTGRVTAVAFSPDGKQVASAWDQKIRLWDVATGASQGTLKGHTGGVNAVAFSPDGKQVASVSLDLTIRLWDAATGASQHTLKGHTDWVTAVAFSPDGKQVASASWDKTIRLWDVATGASQGTLKDHTGEVNAVAFSPDGKQVASASWDQTIRLWDTATEVLQSTLEGHTDWVTAVAFLPDGKQVASASWDKTIRLWDVATGALQGTLESYTDSVDAVAFSPDGKQVALASGDQTIRLWDAATGASQDTLEGHTGRVTVVAFSPDGKHVASASRDRTIRLWDVATGASQGTLKGHTGEVNAVAFSPDGKQVASVSSDLTIRLWDAATGASQHTLKGHTGWVTAVAFSPDSNQVASASGDQTIRLWDAATGASQGTLEGHTDRVNAVAFSPGSKQVASASSDKTIRLWDVATERLLGAFDSGDFVSKIMFSADGTYLETDHGQIQLISASDHTASQSPSRPWTLHANWLISKSDKLWFPPEFRPICSAAHGNFFATGHSLGQVIIWEVMQD